MNVGWEARHGCDIRASVDGIQQRQYLVSELVPLV